jgi:hypothetical protein
VQHINLESLFKVQSGRGQGVGFYSITLGLTNYLKGKRKLHYTKTGQYEKARCLQKLIPWFWQNITSIVTDRRTLSADLSRKHDLYHLSKWKNLCMAPSKTTTSSPRNRGHIVYTVDTWLSFSPIVTSEDGLGRMPAIKIIIMGYEPQKMQLKA